MSDQAVNPTATYTFKYEADSNSIDLNTLLVSQVHFMAILNELKNEVAPGSDLSIKIRPLEKGSVPFDFILNVSWIENMLQLHNTSVQVVELGSAIVGGLVALIQLKIWLKGEPAKQTIINNDNTITIINSDGSQMVIAQNIYNIYVTNIVVDKAISKAFDAIDKDEEVSGVEVLNEKKQPLVTIPRAQFAGLVMANPSFDKKKKTELMSNATLVVSTVVFDQQRKWQFYLENGRKITAGINDENFIDKINNGESFSKGDVLIANLEIEKVYDKSLDMFVEQSFTLTKVIRHNTRPPQSRIDFDN